MKQGVDRGVESRVLLSDAKSGEERSEKSDE